MGGIGISRKPCISISGCGLSVEAGEMGIELVGYGLSVEAGERAAGEIAAGVVLL